MNVLYDIGRVLLDFDYDRLLAPLLPANPADARERLEKVLVLRDVFEAGALGEEEFIGLALEELGSEADADAFRAAWRGIFTPVPAMWETVERLAADGHRLILFSNINPIHTPWIFDHYPVFDRFLGAVLSFEALAMKPDPAIYRYAIGKYGLVPEETRYIDDMAPNIATGEALGMRCWRYDLHDHAGFETWLAAEIARG